MVIGHLAAALLARARYPHLSVLLLLTATYAADLTEAALSLAGSSTLAAAQYSHSVPVLGGISLFLAIVALLLHAEARSIAAVILVSVSHIPLDWITGVHKPLFLPFGPTVGLNLYQHTALDLALEGGLCICAWLWWARAQTRKVVKWSAAVLACLLLFQAGLVSYTASHSLISLVERRIVSISSHSSTQAPQPQ
jgi:hypothetical protein